MRQWVAISLLLLCAGCGFHLRGQVVLPSALQTLHVTASDDNGDFMQQLRAQLIRHQIILQRQANVTLAILKQDYYREIASQGSNTQLRQYNLNLVVIYQLLDKKQNDITKPRQIRIVRSFASNTNQVLGSTNEEIAIKNDMIAAATEQLLTQLSSARTRLALQKQTKR